MNSQGTTPLLESNHSLHPQDTLSLPDQQSTESDERLNSNSSKQELQQHHINEDTNGEISNMSASRMQPFHTIIHKFLRNTSKKTSTKLVLLLLSGIVLGLIAPKNADLPSPFIQYLSSIIGYTYFLCWSISFYPQIILNYKRKNTTGLSVDFSLLNVVGFACYSIYVSFLFWNVGNVRDEYQQRFHNGNDKNGSNSHGHASDDENSSDIAVQSNDVAFALHAFVLSSIQVGQIMYYKRKTDQQVPIGSNSSSNDNNDTSESSLTSTPMTRNIFKMIHRSTKYFLISCIITCTMYAVFIIYDTQNILLLDYLYMLSSIKLIITIVKYIPQALLNHKRKSTVGWNIWNVLLDFSGGLLSLVQLIMDAWSMNDFTAITGNWVKFGLSFVSLFFDVSCLVFSMVHESKKCN